MSKKEINKARLAEVRRFVIKVTAEQLGVIIDQVTDKTVIPDVIGLSGRLAMILGEGFQTDKLQKCTVGDVVKGII